MHTVKRWMFYFTWAIVALLFALFPVLSAFAGTSHDKALAAVAVARAMIAVADEHPELQDTTNRFFNDPPPVAIDSDSPSLPNQESESSPLLPMQLTFETPAGGPVEQRFQFLCYTADGIPEQTWCAPCNRYHRVNKHGDDRAQIEYTTVETPKIWEHGHWRHARRPCTTWTDSSGQTRYVEGFATLDELIEKASKPENDPPNTRGYSATGFAGTIKAKPQITQAFAYWREHIGTTKPDGTPVKVRVIFRRTGGQTFPLIHAKPKQWSFKNIFGELGEFVFEAPGSKLPVNPIRLGYRRDGDDIALIGEIKVKPVQFGLPGDTIHASGAVYGEPAGFGPLTILTIVSLVRDIVAILNPTCDLTLGGQLSATVYLDESRNCLQIDFEDAPQIKLVMLWQFDLGIRQLIITPDKLHVEFSGSNWVKSRDFVVE